MDDRKLNGPMFRFQHARHLFDVECTAHDCKHRETITTSPICPGLAGTEAMLARPGVVWFGEKPHRIQDIMSLAERADLCIVVGTSSIVQPVSKIAGIVKKNAGKVAAFNVDRTNHDDEADFLFL
ncbi:hypothetical protein BDZ89DRAFT_1076833, partial [Hymenopellis radicata]